MKNPRNIFIASALMLVLFMQIIYGIPVPMNYVFLIVTAGFVCMKIGLFTLVMISCSPMLSGPGINKAHRQINMGGLWACAIITLWSFVAYFTGQGQYIAGFVNGHMGVTGHPNFLRF